MPDSDLHRTTPISFGGRLPPILNESVINKLRLTTGLVMFSYVTVHLINLSLGLISIEVMDAFLSTVVRFWQNPVVTLILAASLVIHILLALRALYRRRSLRMPLAEAMQLALGLAIPFLLALHLAKTRLAEAELGAVVEYRWEFLSFLVADRVAGTQQLILLVCAWAHGCIGINYSLRFRRWYPRLQPALLLAAVLVPLLALLGFFEAGRLIVALAENPADKAALAQASRVTPADASWFAETAHWLRVAVYVPVVAILVLRVARWLYATQLGSVTLSYPAGRNVRIARGTSVLEASRMNAIPHASICGGRGRCTTCRVAVGGHPEAVPQPGAAEASVLARLRLPASTRLACQLRPLGNLSVTPLVAPEDTRRAIADVAAGLGVERVLAILFCDLRGFTGLSEHRLPYDTVYLLNGYFAEMGRAIEAHGGHIDKFIGDGIMAVFGIEGGDFCRKAVLAAAAMSQRLDALNDMMRDDLPEPLRIGIGIDCGPVVLGEMGYGRAKGLTAIGDAVNTASRLQDLCKTYAAEVVISAEVEDRAGFNLSAWPRHEIAPRGRTQALSVRIIENGSALIAAPAERAMAANDGR